MKTSPTLKGHGQEYYLNQAARIKPILDEAKALPNVYRKDYIENLETLLGQYQAIWEAYNIINA